MLARAYGYSSWPTLKAFVDGVTVRRLVDAVQAGDITMVEAMLRVRPELATMDVAPNDEHQALHYAVIAQHPDMVRLLMRHGANARKGIYPHRDASTAHVIARDRGLHEMVAVIEDEEHRSGRTRPYGDGERSWPLPPAIAAAVQRGEQDVLIAFLDANPALMQHNEYLLTPLHRAAMMLWDRVTLWMLDHGADINARIDGGPSPVEIAGCGYGPAYDNRQERVRRVTALLRSRGAEMTPRAAVAHGDLHTIERHHAAGTLDHRLPKNQGLRGLLQVAVMHNQPDALRLLLELGFDSNEPVRIGTSADYVRHEPLTAAVRTGRTGMAETLLMHGATLTPWAAILLGKGEWLRAQHAAGTLQNEIGQDGGLVSMAVMHDRPDMLALLLDLGLDPNERAREAYVDGDQYAAGRPLQQCVSAGRHAMARLLLERGADPNDPPGTALFQAHRERDAAMIDLLMAHGTRVTPDIPGYLRDVDLARRLLDEDSSTLIAEALLDPAATGGSPAIVALALERIAWPRDDARWFGILRSTMVLWHEIPWIRRADWAMDRSTHVDCLRLLLQRCDPNVRARLSQTPLHEVASLGEWITDAEVSTFATLLLDAGARLDVRDDILHSTPLGWACRWGRVPLAALLLERGADPIEPAAEPWATPLAWAQKGGHAAIVERLSQATARSTEGTPWSGGGSQG